MHNTQLPIINLLLPGKGLRYKHVLYLQYDHMLILLNQKKERIQGLPVVRGRSELEDEH